MFLAVLFLSVISFTFLCLNLSSSTEECSGSMTTDIRYKALIIWQMLHFLWSKWAVLSALYLLSLLPQLSRMMFWHLLPVSIHTSLSLSPTQLSIFRWAELAGYGPLLSYPTLLRRTPSASWCSIWANGQIPFSMLKYSLVQNETLDWIGGVEALCLATDAA